MMALGGNFVYAKEGSLLGNIGVIARGAAAPPPEEDLILSGPFKQIGYSSKGLVEAVEVLKESFIEKVVSQRGSRLHISRDQLTDARVYFGSDALRAGLIDAIGTRQDAINKAVELAGIGSYGLTNINRETGKEKPLPSLSAQLDRYFKPGPFSELFYLYVEPSR